MRPALSRRALIITGLIFVFASPPSAAAAPMSVRFTEGAVQGFLLLRDSGGQVLASGDWWQIPRKGQIETHLRFAFRDGSLSHETFTYTQDRVFTLHTYRLVQHGPSFPQDIEATVERPSGRYTVRHRPKSKSEDTVDEGTLELPDDLYASGMLAVLLRNLGRDEGFNGHMVVFTPKPRLVRIDAQPAGEDSFSLGGESRQARRYVVKPELGGVLGVVAPLVGKAPPDLLYWMAGEGVPTFVRFEGPLYPPGPTWPIEFAAPQWSGARSRGRRDADLRAARAGDLPHPGHDRPAADPVVLEQLAR